MKIAVWDLECSALNTSFGVLLTGGIKPLGGKPVVLWKGRRGEDDRKLCIAVRDELEKYDLLISYYGLNFDLPFLQSRLIYWDERPIAVRHHIDVYRVVRRRIKLRTHSRRLDVVSEYLGVGGKTRVEPEKWVKAAMGRGKKAEEALKYIREHNELDLIVLENVYNKVVRFIGRIDRH